MAGRISPLLDRGNEYSWKVPLAIIDGVVLGCEWIVGESISPTVDVGVNESPQAESNSINAKRKGKPNRDSQGDRKGAPLLYTTVVFAPYLVTSEDLTNLEYIIEISPVIASSIVIRSEVSLLNHNSKHSIINQLYQACADKRVLPIPVCIVGQTIYFNAQVIICQALPSAVLIAFEKYLYSLTQKLLSETPYVLIV